MATITLHDNEIHTGGDLPRVGAKAPDFLLTDSALSDVSISEWTGRKKLMSIFPSIDTPLPVEVFDGASVASLDFALQELVTVQALSENQAPRRTYRRLE